MSRENTCHTIKGVKEILSVFRRDRIITKSDWILGSSCLSVRTDNTAPNEIWWAISPPPLPPKICRQTASFIKIWEQRALYTKTHVHLI